MKILRTPDQRFQNLSGYSFDPHYVEIPDGEGGVLRVHSVDEDLARVVVDFMKSNEVGLAS